MSKSKILFFVNDLSFFLSHRIKIAEACQTHGYDVIVMCPDDAKVSKLAELGIRHIVLDLSRGRGNLARDFLATISLFRILRDERPGIVHGITSKPVILGGAVTRILGIPMVAAISGLGHVFISNRIKDRILRKIVIFGYRFALHRKDAWAVFQNDENRELFLNLDITERKPVMIRGSGVDLGDFNPGLSENEVPVVLMPCRMLVTKGVHEFVSAARKLKKDGFIAQFVLLGDPDPANPASVAVETLVQWSQEGAVNWVGHSNDIVGKMRKSDIIVLPSYNEGFPKTLIDAAAAGRPSVTTDVTGCRDAVMSGKTALLARPQDAADLAEKIAVLLEDKEMRKKMGIAARRYAEKNFSIVKIVHQHMDLYAKILTGNEATL